MVLSAAKEGYPILVLADSGGAATAIYNYFDSGMDGVAEDFVASEAKFDELLHLHEDQGSRCLEPQS